MSPKENPLDAFIEATLREAFNKKQEEELAKFEADLPSLIEKRRDIVARAAAEGIGPSKATRRASTGGSRLSWTALSDAKKEKWIADIIDAGKGKAKREALIESFTKAEGFKLRESIIDKVQAQAAST